MTGVGPAGSAFNGIIPGNKQDNNRSALMIITNFGIYPLPFINISSGIISIGDFYGALSERLTLRPSAGESVLTY
jgi:hypothetical protein